MIRYELLNKVLEVKSIVIDAKAIEIINEMETIIKQELEDQSDTGDVSVASNDALDAIMYGWGHFFGWCKEHGGIKHSNGNKLNQYCRELRG
jgi:hypothetical protein